MDRTERHTFTPSVTIAGVVAALVTAVLGCGEGWDYNVHYHAETPKARLELASRLEELETEGSFVKDEPPEGRYRIRTVDSSDFSVSYRTGLAPGHIDGLMIHCSPAKLRNTDRFKEFRQHIEEKLGPRLMELLKVETDLYPTP